jgi:uncharacterized membrane protein (UPF0127 family)
MAPINNIKKENVYPFAIIFFFIAVVALFVYQSEPAAIIKKVRIGGESIRVELATTPREQALGLSGRDSLGEQEGMLFIFDKPGEYLFWMKGMNFPIDIIWIDEYGEVIYIKKEAQPESYLETYGPEEEAKYVLEVVAGFSDKNKIDIGDRARFIY